MKEKFFFFFKGASLRSLGYATESHEIKCRIYYYCLDMENNIRNSGNNVLPPSKSTKMNSNVSYRSQLTEST